MSRLSYSLPAPAQGFDLATADMIVATNAICALAAGDLRLKCAVIQSAVDSGKRFGELTVDQLVAMIQQERR